MTDKNLPDVKGVTQYDGAAGGWGALKAVGGALHEQTGLVAGAEILAHMNQHKGFDCPGCAWPDPKHTSPFEYCENGAKAVSWEATTKRADLDFFAAHTVSQILEKSDYEIENFGRLTHPMVYDAASDHYVPISWEDAFARIGGLLKSLDPKAIELYTSGRASNEAAFLYQIFGRAHGVNNFPDCSNMCHEPTSRSLPESIGGGKGPVKLEDFEYTDLILSFGHNPGTNHPRMMTSLHNASKRGVKIIVFNPFKERALERFMAPQNPLEMVTDHPQPIASTYVQVANGGDVAVLKGLIKRVFEREAESGDVLDHAFINEHTAGLDALRKDIDATSWDAILEKSQVSKKILDDVADSYIKAERVIASYGMGITQHMTGTANIQLLVDLLLLRGNMGRQGAGICPLRGHSNVQGNRTVGITERPSADLLDGVERAFGFRPVAEYGHDSVKAMKAIIAGESKALVCLGGNFAVALPDPDVVFPAVRKLDLAVYLATKLNRSHLLTCKNSFLLPVRARSEIDEQTSGPQAITVEDSMSMTHASHGRREPPSPDVRSEVSIVAGIAKATLDGRHAIDWDAMTADYARIRDKIEIVFPEFKDFNKRIEQPGGFQLPVPAMQRIWKTPNGKANFVVFEGLGEDLSPTAPDALTLMTMRSHDQYNTTIYSLNDRYRGITGRRDILFMSEADLSERGLIHGDLVDVEAIPLNNDESKVKRIKRHLTVIAYDLPKGSVGAYFPETNVLIALDHYDPRSGTPAYKSVPVKVMKAQSPMPAVNPR